MIMFFVSLASCVPITRPTNNFTPKWLVDSVVGIEMMNMTPSDDTLPVLWRPDVPDPLITVKKIP